jgi:hypothetical protein
MGIARSIKLFETRGETPLSVGEVGDVASLSHNEFEDDLVDEMSQCFGYPWIEDETTKREAQALQGFEDVPMTPQAALGDLWNSLKELFLNQKFLLLAAAGVGFFYAKKKGMI